MINKQEILKPAQDFATKLEDLETDQSPYEFTVSELVNLPGFLIACKDPNFMLGKTYFRFTLLEDNVELLTMTQNCETKFDYLALNELYQGQDTVFDKITAWIERYISDYQVPLQNMIEEEGLPDTSEAEAMIDKKTAAAPARKNKRKKGPGPQ